MILGFVLGFIAAIVMVLVIGGAAQRYAIKKGWFASAIWCEKEQIWKVRGSYLAISGKIYDGITSERVDGKKRVKYVD